jgi:hypothetical protein
MQEASDRCGQHHNMTSNFLVGRLNPESFDPWEEEACVPQANRLEQRTAISAITLANLLSGTSFAKDVFRGRRD